MQIKDVIDRTLKIAVPIAEAEGLSVWDVEFEKEGGVFMLTVYLDKEGGVSIDECERVSRSIDPVLDKEDYISETYTFCVSSAGLTRRLKKAEHFAYAMGKRIEIRLFKPADGQKSMVGTLIGYDNGDVTLALSGGQTATVYKGDMAAANLYFEI